MPSWAWVVTYNGRNAGAAYSFQCPLGLELLLKGDMARIMPELFQCPLGLELLQIWIYRVYSPWSFQCPLGLELLLASYVCPVLHLLVSMPSRAWVVTARMSNILNFSWCFLCIPAIYRCILAYLPIFFNQLSKFLRCESPSTFLGTCLSHHYFIIFLVTNTNTLLSGLYLISTDLNSLYYEIPNMVCQCPLGLIPHFYRKMLYTDVFVNCRVNALSGLYLISTVPLQKPRFYAVSRACFCRYLSEYSDNSCFSCMLTFWTYLMRCTYPWHWIKYSTNYNRCHPIFSLSW